MYVHRVLPHPYTFRHDGLNVCFESIYKYAQAHSLFVEKHVSFVEILSIENVIF